MTYGNRITSYNVCYTKLLRSAVAESIFGPWRELGNPAIDQGGDTTYESQSSFVLTLTDGNFLYMGDRWCPENAIDGRYIWLPIIFEDGRPVIQKSMTKS